MKRKSEKANHGRVADSDPRLAQPGAGGMLPKSAVPHEGAALEGFITEITPLKRTDVTPAVHSERCEPGSGKKILDPGTGPGNPSGPVVRRVGWESDISNRRQVVGELVQARRLADRRAAELEAVLLAVPAAVWIAHDADCRHISGNRTADDWLCLPSGAEASLTAQGGERPTHFKVQRDGRDLPGEELPVQQAARGLEVRDFEMEIVLADGRVRTLFGNATPLRDAEGRPYGSVAAFVDISERKQVEEALRHQVQLKRHYLDTVQSIIVALDAEGRISMVNRKGRETLGYSEPELLGLNWFENCLPQPAGMDEIYPIFHKIMAGELVAAEYLENPIQCRDGQQRLIAWHNANLTDNTGLIIGTLSSGEDITERKRAEEALRASEASFRQLADAMPQLVWTADPDGNVNYRNNIRFAAYAAVNQTPEGLVSWLPLIHSEDTQRTLEAWQAAIASGNSYACEHRVRMADGTMRWHLSRAEPVRDEAGSIVKWIGTTTDIQDVKQAEERLRESDQRKTEFLATLAHELRNPLAPIRHAAEILRLRAPSDPALQAAHNIIDRQIRHMVRLIDDLLEANRITRGQLRLQRERVELGVLLEQVLAIFRPQAEQAGLTLRVTMPSAPIALDADPVRLAQVFLNLLNNACKYTGRGGTIHLDARCDGAAAVVTVADTGIGIAAEHLPRVFEMFFQLDADSGQSQGGLGIGLALARGLVELHGGHIEVRSQGQGQGTEFTVRLPTLAAPPAGPVLVAEERDASIPFGAARILVVDDNADVLESLAMLLELTGYAVAKARDGQEAIEIAECFRPHLVLLDIGLPRLDGYGVCRRIRDQPWGKDMRIIALTGRGQDGAHRRSRETGFDGHLVKPVDPADLRQLLTELP
jgi:PAS domain S-box-containing protein